MSSWNAIRFELVRAYVGPIRPGGRKRPSHGPSSCFRAWLLLRGAGEYRTETKRCQFRPGKWVIPPQQITWQDFSKEAELISVHFTAAWPDGTFLFEVPEGQLWEAKRHPDLERCARQLQAFVQEHLGGAEMFFDSLAMPLETYLELQTVFQAWIRAFCESMRFAGILPTVPQPIDPRIQKGLEWLNQFSLNSKFHVQSLADHLGLSVVHLNRLFARELRRSPTAILEQRRWERAVQLLQYSRMSVKEIAFDLGFGYPSYFTAWVRSRCGKSPKAFRQV